MEGKLLIFKAKEAFFYRPPPLASTSGVYRAETWGLAKPVVEASIRVFQFLKGSRQIHIELLKQNEFGEEKLLKTLSLRIGERLTSLFTPSEDSSRYFVLHTIEGAKRAHVGIGFREREVAFTFRAALSDAHRQTRRESETAGPTAAATKVDMSLSPGKRLTLHFGTPTKVVEADSRKDSPAPPPVTLQPPPGDQDEEWGDFE